MQKHRRAGFSCAWAVLAGAAPRAFDQKWAGGLFLFLGIRRGFVIYVVKLNFVN